MSSSPFSITTGSTVVVLNAERKGEATFTVTNISGQALRGRGAPKPLGTTGADWLSIAGEAERDFGIGVTQHYTVLVAVPSDAATGNYTFRLDAVGVDNPDENFTQGPVVTFQAAPLPVPPPPPKPFPRWIVAVAAVIVLVGVIAFLLTRPGNFGGTWQTNLAQLNLTQNGTAISGTLQVFGTTLPLPVTGTVNGKTLNGFISVGTLQIPLTLTVAFNSGSFDGVFNSGSVFPLCGVRSGALPDGCGFAGRWNLAGAAPTSGAFANLVQTGPNVSGSFSIGPTNGQVTGTVTALFVSGQFTTQGGGSGPFNWTLLVVDGKDDQFQGSLGGQPSCGFRDGSTASSPCVATRVATPPALLP